MNKDGGKDDEMREKGQQGKRVIKTLRAATRNR